MKKQLYTIVLLSGCVGVSGETDTSSVAGQIEATTYVESSVSNDVQVGDDGVPFSLLTLEERAEKYDALQRDFERQGLVFGIIRGTLIGAVIGGESGALVGAALGGALGASAAKQVSVKLIDEHRNYLLQKESIEAVIAAARADTLEISHDVALIQAASNDIKLLMASNTPQGSGSVSTYKGSASKVAKRISERNQSLLVMEALVEASGQSVSELRIERLKQAELMEQLTTGNIVAFSDMDNDK